MDSAGAGPPSNREQGRSLYGVKAEQSSVVRLVSGLRQFVVGVAQLGDRVSARPQRGHYGRAVAGVLADCKAAVSPCFWDAENSLIRRCVLVIWKALATLCQRLSAGAVSSVSVTDMSSTVLGFAVAAPACGICLEPPQHAGSSRAARFVTNPDRAA